MVYGGSVPAITAIYAPAITPATPAVCSTLATNVSPVAYASSCSGAVDSNYTFSYVNGSVSVTPAPVTVTASDDTMVYGGIVPTITAAYSPAIIPAHSSCLFNPSHERFPGRLLCLQLFRRRRFQLHFQLCERFCLVTPAPVTVTTSDDTMVYGGSVPAITAIYAPAITPATPAVCLTLATNVSPVGSYASSCSGAVDSNYTFSYVNGSVSSFGSRDCHRFR